MDGGLCPRTGCQAGELGIEAVRRRMRYQSAGWADVPVLLESEGIMVNPISGQPEPTPQKGDRACDCWVRLQSEVDRFGIRYGAHNPECPVFKPTLDPFDNLRDAELRMYQEDGTGQTGENLPSREKGCGHP